MRLSDATMAIREAAEQRTWRRDRTLVASVADFLEERFGPEPDLDALVETFNTAFAASRDNAGYAGSGTEVKRQHDQAVRDGLIAIGVSEK